MGRAVPALRIGSNGGNATRLVANRPTEVWTPGSRRTTRSDRRSQGRARWSTTYRPTWERIPGGGTHGAGRRTVRSEEGWMSVSHPHSSASVARHDGPLIGERAEKRVICSSSSLAARATRQRSSPQRPRGERPGCARSAVHSPALVARHDVTRSLKHIQP